MTSARPNDTPTLNLHVMPALAAFFFGLIGLVQTLLFLVLAALLVKRENMDSKLVSRSNAAAEMSDWNLSTTQKDEIQGGKSSDGADTGTTDFVKMTDVNEQENGGEVVLV